MGSTKNHSKDGRREAPPILNYLAPPKYETRSIGADTDIGLTLAEGAFLLIDICDRAIPLIEDHGKLSLVKKLF